MDYSHLSPEQLAIKQQLEIQQLQAASSAQMTSNMLAMSSANNAAQLAANQQRMQQLQMEILRGQQVMANQLDMRRSEMRNVMYGSFMSMPGADPGTTGIFGRNIGIGPGGFTTQNFGGQLYNAFGGRMMNRLTGGLFFQDYAFQFGASRAEVERRSQDQLITSRLYGAGRGIYASIIPQSIRTRFGDGFVGDKTETQLLVAGMLSHLRGRALGTMATPDRVGAGLRSDLVTALTDQIDTSFNNLNKNRFGADSITSQDLAHLRGGVLAALDERTIQGALKGRSEPEAAKILSGRADSIIGAVKTLSDKLQLNAEATGKLLQSNRALGFSVEHLFAGANYVRGIQSSVQMSGDELIGTYNQAAASGRSRGFDSARYAQVQIGQAALMARDLMNRPDLLASQGGTTLLEQAMNFRGAITANAPQFARRYGSTLGILAANDGNPLAIGKGVFGMSSVAAILAKNPFAGLEALQDPKAQARLNQNTREQAYRSVRSLPIPKVMQVMRYAEILGIDPVMARQDFDAQLEKDMNIRKSLSASNLPTSELGSVLNYQAKAIEQGLSIEELSSDELVASYSRSKGDRSRQGILKSLPDDLRKSIMFNDLKSLGMYMGSIPGMFGRTNTWEAKKKLLGTLDLPELPESVRSAVLNSSQQEVLDAIQEPGTMRSADSSFPNPVEVLSGLGDSLETIKDIAKVMYPFAKDAWNQLRKTYFSFESRSSTPPTVEVHDRRLADILEKQGHYH